MMAAQWSILLQLYGILLIISESFGKNAGEKTGGMMILIGILLPILPLIKSRDSSAMMDNARQSWADGKGLSFRTRVVTVARKTVEEEEYYDGEEKAKSFARRQPRENSSHSPVVSTSTELTEHNAQHL